MKNEKKMHVFQNGQICLETPKDRFIYILGTTVQIFMALKKRLKKVVSTCENNVDTSVKIL